MVLDLVQKDVLPAAGAAALVLAAVLGLCRTLGGLGAATAILAAYVVANFAAVPHDEPIAWEHTHRLIPWIPGRSAFHLLPRAGLVLLGVGLASQWLGCGVKWAVGERLWWLPSLIVWLPRWIAILIVSSWLIPPEMIAEKNAWLKPAFGLAMLAAWIALDETSRRSDGGLVAALIAAAFFASSVVFIYAHSSLFLELAIVLGSGFLGLAVVTRATHTDCRGGIPAAVAFLPGLALNVKYQSESLVPVAAFTLLALAPLGFLPLVIPRISRQNRWLIGSLRIVLVLTPLIVAVLMAIEHEQLPPEEEW
jgi:hypothetical protein